MEKIELIIQLSKLVFGIIGFILLLWIIYLLQRILEEFKK